MDSKKYVLFAYTLITLTILDIITTHYAINYFGLSEGNPIMAMVVSSLPLFVMAKMFFVMFIIAMYRILLKRDERIASIGQKLIIGMMILVVSSNMIQIASAESGTLSISDEYINIGYHPANGFVANTLNLNYSAFSIDSTDYTSIDSYVITFGALAPVTFATNGKSTAFSIISGGSGSGIASYDKTTRKVYWFFNHATISGSPLILSYTTNIFTDITVSGTKYHDTSAVVSSTNPMYIRTSSGTTVCGVQSSSCSDANSIAHDFVGSTDVTNSYSLTYSIIANTTYYTLNVSKSGATVPTAWNEKNITRVNYTYEACCNLVSFEHFFALNDGLVVNMTISTGEYATITLNDTTIPTIFPDQPTLDTTGYQLAWWTDSFIVDTANNFSVRVNDPDTLNLYNYNVIIHNSQSDEIFRDDDILKEDQLDYSVVLSTYGTYVVYLQRCFFFVCTSVAQDRIDPTDDLGVSTITMNSTQFMRVPFNVTITLGYTPVYANMIALIIYDRNGVVVDADYTVHENGNIANFDKTYPPGSYTIKLHDIQKNVVLASRQFTVIQVPGQVPVQNITQNYITLDGTFFVLGEYSYLRWSINDSLWQNRTMYYENYNYNISEVTARDSLIEQREFQQVSFAYMTDTGCALGALCYYRAGENQMRLVAKNVTSGSTEIISFWNYTLGSTTSSGWGLILPAEVKVDEIFTIQAIVPDGQLRANIYIYDPSIGNSTRYFSVFQRGGTSTYRLKISRGGFYDVVMLDDDKIIQFRQALHVGDNGTSSNPAISGVPAAGQAGSDGISPTDSLDTYVRALRMGLNPTSKLLFSIILIIIFGIAALWFSKGQGNIAALVMFAPYAFFLYVDYIPKWTFIIVIILIGISTKLFR